METGTRACALLNNKLCSSKRKYIVVLLFCAHNLFAQKSSTIFRQNLRFQLDFGCNYSYFPDKKQQLSGLAIFPEKLYMAFVSRTGQSDRNVYLGATYGVKAIYKNKHVLCYNHLDFSAGVYLKRLTTGQYAQFYSIDALGYGYQFSLSKFNLSINSQVCYRTGLEQYLVHFYPTSPYQNNPTKGTIVYQRPLGGSISLQADYFISNNFGLGLSCGYYFFPFENAKLNASFLHLINPTMEVTTFPNKEVFHSSLKLFYNFTLPERLKLFKRN